MIVTREEQEKLFNEYINQKKNLDQCDGFLDGFNKALEFVDAKLKQEALKG